MEYLARLNIVAMLMSTTFWINLAVVFSSPSLLTGSSTGYLMWSIKRYNARIKRMMLMGSCGLLFSRC